MTKEEYSNFISKLGRMGLVPMTKEPTDLNILMQQLAREGEVLLQQEGKKKNPIVIKPSPKVSAISPLSDLNPYVKARNQILNGLTSERRKALEEMERTKNTNNREYSEFAAAVAALGDKLSS